MKQDLGCKNAQSFIILKLAAGILGPKYIMTANSVIQINISRFSSSDSVHCFQDLSFFQYEPFAPDIITYYISSAFFLHGMCMP